VVQRIRDQVAGAGLADDVAAKLTERIAAERARVADERTAVDAATSSDPLPGCR